MVLLRFASDIKHNEHQPTPWKMRPQYLPFPFTLWHSSEFNQRGQAGVKDEVQFHFSSERFVDLLKKKKKRWFHQLGGAFSHSCTNVILPYSSLILHKIQLGTFKVQKLLDNQPSAFICQEEQFQQTVQRGVRPEVYGRESFPIHQPKGKLSPHGVQDTIFTPITTDVLTLWLIRSYRVDIGLILFCITPMQPCQLQSNYPGVRQKSLASNVFYLTTPTSQVCNALEYKGTTNHFNSNPLN